METLGDIGERINLLIRQGATFGPHRVTLTSPDGSPVDLVGSVVRGQMRVRAGATGAPLADFAVAMIDAAGGIFEFGLSATVTAQLPAAAPGSDRAVARWDMELEDAAGRVIPLFWGEASVVKEVTRP